MSDIVIKAEQLGKKYIIGHQRENGRYTALRDVLMQNARSVWNKTRDLVQGKPIVQGDTLEEVWALKDVNFEIRRGEAVGIIGRNGAGKSTLLKVLSRITEPSAGRVSIRGRVASLLEVGTGFHPELTGRENIYLNGAILGMTRLEIKRKFDEIVAFAEVEKFLDTPVKRYSSGMYVRLAFAVAAHLEPEILVVDEVLAVGDSAFQKKCLGKMGDVAHEGRTVLFVSHNMVAIEQLCQKAMVLQQGKVADYGSVEQALGMYLTSVSDLQKVSIADRTDRRGNQFLRFTRVALCDAGGSELEQVLSGQDVYVRFYYAASEQLCDARVHVSLAIVDRGRILINLNSYNSGSAVLDVYERGFFECVWKNFNLTAGSYDCIAFCSVNDEVADWVDSAFTILVENGDFFGQGDSTLHGIVLVPHRWYSHPDLS
ncbi:ABC transporter ATP-binding protein [Candidatus Chloroploca sp. M-50]|uniref:ABC transporter ATP-binding protein n=1 Tax=Candidatus Chloroploca mongolica TaxID=2528176 RepID=A0ABS4D8F1_9CHLR|nr:ABC transporter ATP-binding protein [Candidatus Chloroploca mongolica]MBP1465724.1 ABC transporter ATP-binding protein [Candidatus Chloroploca mongolica]